MRGRARSSHARLPGNAPDFATMNKIYAEYFKTQPPARATVEVARLPRDVLIEIAVVAAKP